MAMFLDNSEQFEKLKNMMPELITEFKTDLSTEDNKLIREFFVLPNKRVSLGGSVKHRLVYYEDDHKGLRNKIDILENHGFLIDVTPGNTPIYRMTEEFVELIMKYVNKSKQLCITQNPIFEEDKSNIISLLKKDYLLKNQDSLKEETAGIVQDFISRGLYNSTECTSKQLQAHFDHINKLLDHILELLKKDFADIPLKQIKEKLFTITDEEYKKLVPIANSHLVNAGLAQPDILKIVEQQINNKKKKAKQTIETRIAISEKQRASPKDKRELEEIGQENKDTKREQLGEMSKWYQTNTFKFVVIPLLGILVVGIPAWIALFRKPNQLTTANNAIIEKTNIFAEVTNEGTILRSKNFPWKITKTKNRNGNILYTIVDRRGDSTAISVVPDNPKYNVYQSYDGMVIKFTCDEEKISNFTIKLKY